jgi:AraC-like DNA-binding protein
LQTTFCSNKNKVIPAICSIGFLGSILLYFFADKVNPANRYLAYHFFLNSLFGISHWASILTDSENLRALFLIHYFPVYLLNTPFLYFYIRAVLTEKIHIKGYDYLHFLPFLIMLINIIPYSMLPWQEKLNFAYQFHQNFGHIYEIYFPFVSFAVYFVLRSVLSLAYIIASALIVRKAILKEVLGHNKTLKFWLLICLGLVAIFNLTLVIFSIYSLLNNDFVLMLDEQGGGRTIATILMSAFTISIYFFPKVLYGLQLKSSNSLVDIIPLNEDITTTISKTPDVSSTRLKQVDKLIESHMLEKKYLLPGYALSDLVKIISIPEHVLTYYFNNYMGITFLKWKNKLRIEEAIQLLKSGEADTKTLESVGKACGYKSRSNFIQAFKSHTGESPSNFLKKLS